MSAHEARTEADYRLQQFRLVDWATAPVLALSGGMAQRLMVARAILHRPAILFLDEPTAGLDPQSRLALWDILGELHAAGETILLTTHYMEEADQLCNRVAIMDHGHILALDTPAELKKAVTADTIVTVSSDGDLAQLERLLADQIKGVHETRRQNGSVVLNVAGSRGILPEVVNAAEHGGFNVTDLSIAEPTLETVFITLTGKDLRD
jgi:ABC-2 type transport system ATP-binding protein